MNPKKVKRDGRHFERKAFHILEDEGYKIIEHTSSINPISVYDFIVEKDKKRMYVEVRGRNTLKDDIPFQLSKKKFENLIKLGMALVLILNKNNYKIFNLEKNQTFYISKPRKKIDEINYKDMLKQNPFQSKQLKALKKQLDEMDVDEIIRGEVKAFGTSAHLNMVRKHIGKKAITLILKQGKGK